MEAYNTDGFHGLGHVGLEFHGWGGEGGEDRRLIDLNTFIHVARLWTTAVRLWCGPYRNLYRKPTTSYRDTRYDTIRLSYHDTRYSIRYRHSTKIHVLATKVTETDCNYIECTISGDDGFTTRQSEGAEELR